MKIIFLAIIIGFMSAIIYGDEAPARIDGYCYYCNTQGQPIVLACSVVIYCKRLHDGVVFVGNSKKYDPSYYVAQSPPGNDVYIEPGPNNYYAVASYKYNSSGPFAGAWKMDYTGTYYYPHKDFSSGRCNIYLRRIPGTEPQGSGND